MRRILSVRWLTPLHCIAIWRNRCDRRALVAWLMQIQRVRLGSPRLPPLLSSNFLSLCLLKILKLSKIMEKASSTSYAYGLVCVIQNISTVSMQQRQIDLKYRDKQIHFCYK